MAEDTVSPAGTTVGSLVGSAISDLDFGAVKGVAVIGVTGGTWQYNTGGGWAEFAGVSAGAARLLRDSDSIRFVPDPDFNGTATLDVRAWDRTTGSVGGTADLSSIEFVGRTTAFSHGIETVSVQVTEVNDAPDGMDDFLPAVAEDSPAQRIAFGALLGDDSGGPANEAGQSLTITAVGNAVGGMVALDGTDVVFTPTPDFNGTASFSYTLGDNGTTNGSPDFLTSTASASFSVTAVNDSPTLPALPPLLPLLPAIRPNNVNPAGVAVSSLLEGASDVDLGAASPGDAVIGTTGNGTWQYRANGTGAWRNVGSVTAASARLLLPGDLVRFVPRNRYNGVATLTFRAWDRTEGVAGGTADLSLPVSVGGITAFSLGTRVARLLCNNAPVLSAASRALAAINEDTASVPLAISSLLFGKMTDADPGAVRGVAVTGTTGNGTWQYSANGRTWFTVGTPSATNALLLPDSYRLRYVPAANANGVATLTFRGWDRKLGVAGETLDLTKTGTGGSSTVSAATARLSIVVKPVNDAPRLPTTPVTLPAVSRTDTNPAGSLVADLLVGVLDPDAGPRYGVAITAVSGTGGRWQYSLNGGMTWLNLTATPAAARLLRDTDRVRFLPNGTTTGDATLTFRAWDRTSGVPGGVADLSRATSLGGKTAFSLARRTAIITVTT